QDHTRRHLAAIVGQRHGIRTGYGGAGVEGGGPGVADGAAVEALQARDLLVLVGDQRRPVEAGAVRRPAESGRILEVVAEAAGVDQKLLGHAAADHAGAAEAVLLGDRHPGSVLSGNARRPHAARPAANDEEVEVVLAHRSGAHGRRRSRWRWRREDALRAGNVQGAAAACDWPLLSWPGRRPRRFTLPLLGSAITGRLSMSCL